MADTTDHLETASLTSETIRLLQDRVSVRRYADRPVPPEMVDAVLQAAFRAPTSSNIQAYSVIVVRDPETKAALSKVTGNQPHVRDTPVWLGFCADLTRIDRALAMHGKEMGETNLEMGLVSSVDATLVGMSAYLAAKSLGLTGVMIGALRNDAEATAQILGLPRHVYCVFGLCLGWPGDVPPQKPRMDVAAMVHHERYGSGAEPQAALDRYDAALAQHYTDTGKPTADQSWTAEIAAKFAPQPREALRAVLKARGFDFG